MLFKLVNLLTVVKFCWYISMENKLTGLLYFFNVQ